VLLGAIEVDFRRPHCEFPTQAAIVKNWYRCEKLVPDGYGVGGHRWACSEGRRFCQKNVGLLDCGTLAEGPPDLLRVGPCAGPHCTTAALLKFAHSQVLRSRRGRFESILQQLECGIFERTAVDLCLSRWPPPSPVPPQARVARRVADCSLQRGEPRQLASGAGPTRLMGPCSSFSAPLTILLDSLSRVETRR